MRRVSATELKKDLSATINRVAYGGERVVLHRRNKDAVAIVPLEDLKLLEALEDQIDLQAAEEAMREPGTISWDKVKADLGL